ncbi:MAG: chromosome segregation protein SMC [Mobilicoccus sp.]|nr:chromosome segregation protein SMC [Mobilicoccus sp.]
MYVKSLTLKGFKSFASATHFALEPGITCIVGPNGSGKSNVVDALAWVMGEQGAKSLRGGKMEDVIFAGTAGRQALGRAEVTMTIDNSDGALPIDYSEVTISRTMFRSGGSEYAINGTGCRLLDIQELLSDSGIGREMHVIVGQGQLDAVLRATPEERRGFIEEAAGVLKHRKRKERALRKLETMEANLRRVGDLTAEIRRQLGPLGRQAETARRAGGIQAEVRDARLRLLADDLVQFTSTYEAEVADEAAHKARREEAEAELARTREELGATQARSEAVSSEHGAAQERWFALSSVRDRLASTASLAAERARLLDEPAEETSRGRDPEELRAQAASVREEEAALTARVEAARSALEEAVAQRSAAEAAYSEEQDRLGRLARAAADRREGLARLAGKVAAARSRIEAGEAELGRLTTSAERARAGAEEAQREFAVLEASVADDEEGEEDLDAAYEEASEAVETARAAVEAAQESERTAEAERAHAAARREALALSLRRSDGAEVLLDRGADGLLGRIAALLTVSAGREAAVAAALGRAADALAVDSLTAGGSALQSLAQDESGAVTLLVGGVEAPEPPAATWGAASDVSPGAVWAVDAVSCEHDLRGAVGHLLHGTLLVADLDAALSVSRSHPHLTAVTPTGDVVGPGFVHGGGTGAPSLIELEAAVEEASATERDAEARRDRARFALASGRSRLEILERDQEAALADLHASDARLAGVAEQLGRLSASVRSARAEAERITTSAEAVASGLEKDRAALAELEQRHADAQAGSDDDVEPSTDERDRLADAAAAARAAETEARLALRSGEERARAMAGRAEGLENAARQEQQARARAEERRRRRAVQVQVAREVQEGATRAVAVVEQAVALALTRRDEAAAARTALEAELTQARLAVDTLTTRVRELTSAVHADEIARAEQRLRIEGLRARAIDELGIDPDILVEEFGPHRLIPEITPEAVAARMEEEARARAEARRLAEEAARAAEAGEDTPGEEGPDDAEDDESFDTAPQPASAPRTDAADDEGEPFVREVQEKRLKRAERDLAKLGRINPLALEEFAALEERHTFLTEQTDDLRKSRDDLLDIVREVDARVEQAFAEAFADTAEQFEGVFSRLFPGGEGRLTLTDPTNMLTTGIEVEARPPGKKIKRLSLLSGGERSLTAVALLVAIFKARPSPFYIMDEVEAALDDTNLGRLLTIFEELRDSSQLIVITHQKRTMEVADALYGVTMRGDGITTVVSQRVARPADRRPA